MNPAFSAFEQIVLPKFYTENFVQCHHNQSFKVEHDTKKDASTSASPVTINSGGSRVSKRWTPTQKGGGERHQPVIWLNYICQLYEFMRYLKGIFTVIEKLHEYLKVQQWRIYIVTFWMRASSVQFCSFP